jgi:hypothetical protein
MRTASNDAGETSEVRIALGTSPAGGLSLENEIRLLKPALLYADRVTLLSPKATMLSMAAGIGELSVDERLAFLRQVLPAVAPNQAGEVLHSLDIYSALRRKRRRSRDEIIAVERVRQRLDASWTALRGRMDDLLVSAGANDLVPALEMGLLEIDPITSDEEFTPEVLIQQFVDALAATLAGGVSYPLFDDATGSLVRSRIAEGLIEPSALSNARGGQVAAASGLMSRLPAFPAATVAEILDIREELRKPLVRFRAAMIGLARLLQQPFYETGFREEVEQAYLEHVAPVLAEIEEAVQANSYLKRLVGAAIGDMKTLVTGVLTLGVTRTADLPPLIAAGAAALTATAEAAWEKNKAARRISAQQFYFLYRTAELLSDD